MPDLPGLATHAVRVIARPSTTAGLPASVVCELVGHAMPPNIASASETTGLKWNRRGDRTEMSRSSPGPHRRRDGVLQQLHPTFARRERLRCARDGRVAEHQRRGSNAEPNSSATVLLARAEVRPCSGSITESYLLLLLYMRLMPIDLQLSPSRIEPRRALL